MAAVFKHMKLAVTDWEPSVHELLAAAAAARGRQVSKPHVGSGLEEC